MRVMGWHIVCLNGVDPNACSGCHGRRNTIISSGWTPRPDHLGAAGNECLNQDRRLRLCVQAHPNASPFQRLIAFKLGAESSKHWHVATCPTDTRLTALSE